MRTHVSWAERALARCQPKSLTSLAMILSANLGFPRIGSMRELKTTLEKYWSGAASADDLRATAGALRARHWFVQAKAGLDHIPSNDFSLYDQMLDTIAMLGAFPPQKRSCAAGSVFRHGTR